jgi:NAD(P)-dependent dehydrogenase (short-subunit alcohol dehydrogenase family)
MTSQTYTIVTGATGAIGAEISQALARRGENLILACRNAAKAEKLRQQLIALNSDVAVLTETLDLTDADSVEAFIERLRANRLHIRALINNAGVMQRRFATDKLGRELTMVVNYHNTKLLALRAVEAFPMLERVVFTTSLTRRFIRRHPNLQVTDATFSQLGTYARSKRAITDFAVELAANNPQLTVTCADPGIVNSSMIHMDRWFDGLADVAFRPFIRSPKHGAIPALRAFTEPKSARIFSRFVSRKLS